MKILIYEQTCTGYSVFYLFKTSLTLFREENNIIIIMTIGLDIIIFFSGKTEICGEIIYDPSGTIVSPDSNGDGFYDDNANCVWHIAVMEDYVIRYTFEEISVELSKNCEIDKVTVVKSSIQF